jgi:hypothetical protein
MSFFYETLRTHINYGDIHVNFFVWILLKIIRLLNSVLILRFFFSLPYIYFQLRFPTAVVGPTYDIWSPLVSLRAEPKPHTDPGMRSNTDDQNPAHPPTDRNQNPRPDSPPPSSLLRPHPAPLSSPARRRLRHERRLEDSAAPHRWQVPRVRGLRRPQGAHRKSPTSPPPPLPASKP